jgi:hypothetical protein
MATIMITMQIAEKTEPMITTISKIPEITTIKIPTTAKKIITTTMIMAITMAETITKITNMKRRWKGKSKTGIRTSVIDQET